MQEDQSINKVLKMSASILPMMNWQFVARGQKMIEEEQVRSPSRLSCELASQLVNLSIVTLGYEVHFLVGGRLGKPAKAQVSR